MKKKNIIYSYAKINLHLEVLNRRNDNYHNLFSLMAELDLHDVLDLVYFDISENPGNVSVEIQDGGGTFSKIIEDIPSEKNLISIAVKKYLNTLGIGGRFIFRLTKNIPAGAGLGGGSSNAAAALKIVSEILEREMDDYLRVSASETGSDVPFFLEGGFAFVEGRGEYITTLDFHDDSFILMVNNGIHVNTGFAYESLKKTVSDLVINCDNRRKLIIERINLTSGWKDIFKNDFEESIFQLFPEIGLIKEKMYQNGAFFASMTGSGSTVFGLFNNEGSAEKARKLLEDGNNRVYFSKFRSKKN